MKNDNDVRKIRKKLLKIYGKQLDFLIRDRIMEKHKLRIGYIKVGKILKGYEDNSLVLEEAILLLKAEQMKQEKLKKQLKNL